MNKQIHFSYDGKDYTLEFTRDTVRQMERGGFSINEIGSKPTTVLDLFAGAFLRHHSTMKRAKADKIYYEIKSRQKLIDALIEMYTETIESLVDEEGDEGNAEWTPNWEIED